MNRYVCIHGHFYQPPRENPWLNEVELQDSAYPYHDWNERINDECYARNTASRILDGEGRIIDIVNNYSLISFNFGPTLLEWMQAKSPDTYRGILEADKKSQKIFNGHGSALAQVYNHMIMPLANKRDKVTQVIWGIRDFEHRFQRKPEGMWLSETAVDTETLEILAEQGITYTILSPYQSKRVRKIGTKEWRDATGGNIDPKQAYLCNLPSGRKINLFFYDGPISQGVAFEKLLSSGERFAHRLTHHFAHDDQPQLMNIATDGETYGHHHYLGEMGLSYALHYIEDEQLAKLTIYGEYLEKFPPENEVEILEDSSWSCVHGVERWRSNCGCNTGSGLGWTQEWRGPLREAFDWVRDQLVPLYEQKMQQYVDDPWKVRNEYIKIILDRSSTNVENFIHTYAKQELSREQMTDFLQLLEMQYFAMLMYTSCGWFFDEVTGIESMQDVAYAARAIQLAKNVSGLELEPDFLRLLEKAKSNLPEHGNAAIAYEKFIVPTRLDLTRVGVHYAISSLFSDYPKHQKVYCYTAVSEKYEKLEAGTQKLAVGKASIRSDVTWEEQSLTFAVLHLGDHNLFAGVKNIHKSSSFTRMKNELQAAFNKNNVYEVIFLIGKYFDTHNYSFWHLFKDDQKRILNIVLEPTIESIESQFEQVYENHYPAMRVFKNINQTLPQSLSITVNFIINAKLRKLFEEPFPDLNKLQKIQNELENLLVKLDDVTLNYASSLRIGTLMKELKANILQRVNQLGKGVSEHAPIDMQEQSYSVVPLDKEIRLINVISGLITVSEKFGLDLDLWHARNLAFLIKKEYTPQLMEKAEEGDDEARQWCNDYNHLCEVMNLKTEVCISQ